MRMIARAQALMVLLARAKQGFFRVWKKRSLDFRHFLKSGGARAPFPNSGW